MAAAEVYTELHIFNPFKFRLRCGNISALQRHMPDIGMGGKDLNRDAVLIIADEVHIMISHGKPAVKINVYLFHCGPTPSAVKLLYSLCTYSIISSPANTPACFVKGYSNFTRPACCSANISPWQGAIA
ncbi:hypothetical protein D3C73_965470 [compost metagenome]